MTNWEYKIIRAEIKGFIRDVDLEEVERELNELGSQGFELNLQFPTSGNMSHTPALAFVMRRAKDGR